MKEKIRDLIYLDSQRYISLDSLKVFYWGIVFIHFSMMMMTIISIDYIGINWKSMFPIISCVVWSAFYWIFVLIIQSKRTKNFELRFLVNGITGLLISSLFWIFFASLNIISDTPFLHFDSFLDILFAYLLFSIVYIVAIIICAYKGIFALIREKSKLKIVLMTSALFTALLPILGITGMNVSRLIRSHTSINTQYLWMTILINLLIFLPALAHINFVQFYFCKKYGIHCDEYGNTMSPELISKSKANKRIKKNKNSKRKRNSVLFKILIGIISVPVTLFVIFFIIGLIKSIMKNI